MMSAKSTVTGGRPPHSPVSDRSRRHHVFFVLLVGAACLVAVAMFANDWLQRDWLGKKWLYRRPTALISLGVFAAFSVAAFSTLLVAWRRGRWRSTSYAPLRWALPILVAAWASVWTIDPPTLVYDGEWALAAALAGWSGSVALLALRPERPERPGPRWAGVLAIAVCEIAAVALVAESGLRLLRRASDLQILATASTNPDAWLRAYRLAPGRFHYGFPVNREGFVDVEPEDAARRAHLVACIGDSFSVAVVPQHLHYTTVAERSFEDLEIYNIGVVNSGPREYLRMMEASALPLHPAGIVIALFVGNDIKDAQRGDPTTLSTWMDRDEILMLQLPRRLWALARERRAGAAIAGPGGLTRTEGLTGEVALTLAEVERQMPWLADPFLEPSELSAQRFAYVEGTRTDILLPGRRSMYEDAFAYLEQMRETARPIPIACLLIPDEYQVEDGLWEELRAEGVLEGADRELPQKILGDWLDDHQIPYIDLLPRLRAVLPLRDGNRHLYHLRDTHFNARGNRIAGAALAELIERCDIARRTRASVELSPR